ncbi:unnamed protein product [Protopolystoma xenopodis]|uniref:Uncharacterized protein n=1 Tax=Protopolystoma xenopodis TaxID=117903 RepID=A0A3S4ZPH5_9PLAT|nr:unnamed protein product [Protopolystoma xenopodis]
MQFQLTPTAAELFSAFSNTVLLSKRCLFSVNFINIQKPLSRTSTEIM